ncbi:inositol-trisphosphate 3-kinase homolog isoform X2 [Lineus longissimus]|uniref:inositol-trisphosphate 3-kinase homolog isoform X2 n=1 Tax=Lineus longissimus TaxID=88925 RepID=UPI00315D1F86
MGCAFSTPHTGDRNIIGLSYLRSVEKLTDTRRQFSNGHTTSYEVSRSEVTMSPNLNNRSRHNQQRKNDNFTWTCKSTRSKYVVQKRRSCDHVMFPKVDGFPDVTSLTNCESCEKQIADDIGADGKYPGKNLLSAIENRDHHECERCTILKGLQNKMADTLSATSLMLANMLALNALDFSLPASDALLKIRNNSWIQLAGHQGLFAPAGPITIWKKCIGNNPSEANAYKGLMADPCRDIVPKFYRQVEYNGDFFIEIDNLMSHFQQPSMMDVKMGYRTFQEAEVKNAAFRKDLYERMIKLDPLSVTENEQKVKAVTKLRYMQFREKESSTSELGFRLEAIKLSGEQLMKSCLRKVKEHDQVIGSSLLFLYDDSGAAGVWLIDFAKTITVENRLLDHTSKWEMGNHEDGCLTGLDNLIKMFQSIQ